MRLKHLAFGLGYTLEQLNDHPNFEMVVNSLHDRPKIGGRDKTMLFMLAQGNTIPYIAKHFGVSNTTILNCEKRAVRSLNHPSRRKHLVKSLNL